MQPKLSDLTTPEVKRAVGAYLLARAYAETMRERVDEIERQILAECPIYAAERWGGEQILTGKRLYLASDDAKALLEDFYAEANHRERKAGLKHKDMPDEHCPALVAESKQCDAENLLIDISGRPFGVNCSKLLTGGQALERRQKWIDLVVGCIVNLSDFRNPLTGRK